MNRTNLAPNPTMRVSPDDVLARLAAVCKAAGEGATTADLLRIAAPRRYDVRRDPAVPMVGGYMVKVSDLLPVYPSVGEDARRIVRHGLADVVAWLGEDVGPRPGEPTHAYRLGNVLVVSREYHDRLLAAQDGPWFDGAQAPGTHRWEGTAG